MAGLLTSAASRACARSPLCSASAVKAGPPSVLPSGIPSPPPKVPGALVPAPPPPPSFPPAPVAFVKSLRFVAKSFIERRKPRSGHHGGLNRKKAVCNKRPSGSKLPFCSPRALLVGGSRGSFLRLGRLVRFGNGGTRSAKPRGNRHRSTGAFRCVRLLAPRLRGRQPPPPAFLLAVFCKKGAAAIPSVGSCCRPPLPCAPVTR